MPNKQAKNKYDDQTIKALERSLLVLAIRPFLDKMSRVCSVAVTRPTLNRVSGVQIPSYPPRTALFAGAVLNPYPLGMFHQRP